MMRDEKKINRSIEAENDLRDPLLLDTNGEAFSEFNSSTSPRMSRKRGRSRCIKVYRLFIQRNMTLLIISCLISTITFAVVFYSSVNYILKSSSSVHSRTPVLVSEPEQQQPQEQQQQQQHPTPSSLPENKPERRKGLINFDRNITYNDFNYLNPDSLTYDNRTYAGYVEILYRFPKKRPINSLLLIFHGCGRSTYEWFHTVERQRIIGAAIDLGYACLAFQATDQLSRCWSNEFEIEGNPDVQMVWKGLENFYKEYPKLESLPRFTFGASSGGVFSSIFATNQRYKIQGQILFISIVFPRLLHTDVKEKSYPPTAWIYMPRDTEFASGNRINMSVQVFAKEHIPHIVYDIQPISLIASSFHDRTPTITSETSSYLFYRLQQNNWLDGENYLIHNPRRDDDWQNFIFAKINNQSVLTPTIYDNLRKHQTILPDIMSTIYGEHEISFERSFEALKWLQDVLNNQTTLTQ